jgi:hypothetical protein
MILTLETRGLGFPDTGYIFAGPKLGKSLNLANLARRTNRLRVGESWCKMLVRVAKACEVVWLTIQAILRHADFETTRKHSIKKNVVPEASRRAMSKLEKVLNSIRKAKHGLLGMRTAVGTTREGPQGQRIVGTRINIRVPALW